MLRTPATRTSSDVLTQPRSLEAGRANVVSAALDFIF
jgi:hypothetical protein